MSKILSILLGLSVFGCASNSYNIRVNSFSDKNSNLEKYSFSVVSAEKKESTLEFKEYADQVKKILEQKGYTFVEDIKKSDVLVFLAYFIDNGQSSTNVSVIPTYGSQYTSTLQNNNRQIIGTVNTSPQNPYMPTGYQPIYSSETNFTRQIILSGFNSSTKSQIWETTITSTGSSDDLRKIFPVMLIGASKEIGTNTHGIKKIDFEISPYDERIRFLNGARRPASIYRDE